MNPGRALSKPGESTFHHWEYGHPVTWFFSIPVLLGIAVLGWALVCPGSVQGQEKRKAPSFQLPRLDGGVVDLDNFKGQVILINFWATWCGDCIKEMPELEKLYNRFKHEGLSVVAVSLDKDEAREIQNFLKKNQLTLSFPIVLDPDGKVARMYRVSWVPATVLIDREGYIMDTILGIRPWGNRKMFAVFERLLASEAGNLSPGEKVKQ